MNTLKRVLSAEDDVNDALFLRQAFEVVCGACQLFHVPDGQEAMDYLNGNQRYASRNRYPLPDLLVLDLHMPRIGGLEVLKWLRAREELGFLPAVLLTSSADEEDVAKARDLGACGYYVKPAGLTEWVRVVSELEAEWLGLALPRRWGAFHRQMPRRIC